MKKYVHKHTQDCCADTRGAHIINISDMVGLVLGHAECGEIAVAGAVSDILIDMLLDAELSPKDIYAELAKIESHLTPDNYSKMREIVGKFYILRPTQSVEPKAKFRSEASICHNLLYLVRLSLHAHKIGGNVEEEVFAKAKVMLKELDVQLDDLYRLRVIHISKFEPIEEAMASADSNFLPEPLKKRLRKLNVLWAEAKDSGPEPSWLPEDLLLESI